MKKSEPEPEPFEPDPIPVLIRGKTQNGRTVEVVGTIPKFPPPDRFEVTYIRLVYNARSPKEVQEVYETVQMRRHGTQIARLDGKGKMKALFPDV